VAANDSRICSPAGVDISVDRGQVHFLIRCSSGKGRLPRAAWSACRGQPRGEMNAAASVTNRRMETADPTGLTRIEVDPGARAGEGLEREYCTDQAEYAT